MITLGPGGDLQNAIDDLYGSAGGGRIFIEGRFTRPVEMKGEIWIEGGHKATSIIACPDGADLTMVHFGPLARGGGLANVSVLGAQVQETLDQAISAQPWTPAVLVDDNIPAMFRDCNIWGRGIGLKTAGVDGTADNCFIQGRVASIWSEGANWWIRCKADNASQQGQQAFYAPPTGRPPAENRAILSDFTGNYVFSVGIADPAFIGRWALCVFGNPIQINRAGSNWFALCDGGPPIVGPEGGSVRWI